MDREPAGDSEGSDQAKRRHRFLPPPEGFPPPDKTAPTRAASSREGLDWTFHLPCLLPHGLDPKVLIGRLSRAIAVQDDRVRRRARCHDISIQMGLRVTRSSLPCMRYYLLSRRAIPRSRRPSAQLHCSGVYCTALGTGARDGFNETGTT